MSRKFFSEIGLVNSHFHFIWLKKIFQWQIRRYWIGGFSIVGVSIAIRIVFTASTKNLIKGIDNLLLIRLTIEFYKEYCSVFGTNKGIFCNICNKIWIRNTMIKCACRLNLVFDEYFSLLQLWIWWAFLLRWRFPGFCRLSTASCGFRTEWPSRRRASLYNVNFKAFPGC